MILWIGVQEEIWVQVLPYWSQSPSCPHQERPLPDAEQIQYSQGVASHMSMTEAQTQTFQNCPMGTLSLFPWAYLPLF